MLNAPSHLLQVPRSGFQEDLPHDFSRDHCKADQLLFSQTNLLALSHSPREKGAIRFAADLYYNNCSNQFRF